MKDVLISVIIPTFKREEEIVKRAVNSVLLQTYRKLEIIVVDDSPSMFAGSKQIKESLLNLNDSRIRYINHNENKGANAARNTGIKAAVGEYVAFLDDDDEWLPEKTQKQLEKFNDPSVAMVYCPYYILHKNERYLNNTQLENGNLFKKLLYDNFIGSTSCVMIKKECVERVGMFDENLPASQDYDLYLRVSKEYLVDYTEEPLMLYYDHGGPKITGNLNKRLDARKYIYTKYKKEIKKYPKINSYKNLALALTYSHLGKKKLKRKHWIKAVVLYPVPSKKLLKDTIKIWFNYR